MVFLKKKMYGFNFLGVFVVSFTAGRVFRVFGWLSMVMCAYGGVYALWCLPSMMIVVDRICRCGKPPVALAVVDVAAVDDSAVALDVVHTLDEISTMKTRSGLSIEHHSAAIIQAHFRGMVARRCVAAMHAALTPPEALASSKMFRICVA